jgi:hypothetical protein
MDIIKTLKDRDCHLNNFDMAIAIFGHEIEHGADSVSTFLLIMERLAMKMNGNDSETRPQKVENLILHDIADKKQ